MTRHACLLACLLIISPATLNAQWKAGVDAPADKPPEWPAEWKLDIAAPKSFFDPVIAFADRGGPFVAVGSSETQGAAIVVYDLRTSKKTGEVTVPKRMPKVALSHDGLILAGYPEDFTKPVFGTFDVTTGKQLAGVPVDLGVDMMAFVGNDKVVYRSRGGRDRDLHLIEAKTGKELTKIAAGVFLDHPPVGSPGGAFLAVTKQDGIGIYLAADGSVVGELSTKVAKPDAKPGAFAGFFQAKGLAFSPDGSLLAAMSDVGGQARFLVWSMRDGKLAHDLSPDKLPMVFFDGPKLEWLPDGSGWLINGTTVIDRETGKVIWTHPADNGSRSSRRAVDAGNIVYLDSTVRDARKLKVATQSKEKIAAIRNSLKSGGTAFDASLPKAITPDFSKAKEVEAPLPGVAWSTVLEPAPATPAVARRPVPLGRKGLEIDGLFVTSGAKPLAVLDVARRDNMFGPVHEATPRQLETVDLTTGKTTATFDLPAGCQIVGVSADGKFAVTRDVGTQQRIDLWSLEKKAHVAGWKPYDREPEAGRKITFAGFAGAVLVTSNANGRVIGWNPADASPSCMVTLPGFQSPAIAPSGRHLVGVQQGVVRFVDAANGSVVGDLEPKATGDFAMQGPIGLRPDGREVAVLLRKAVGSEPLLVRWDAKGKRIEETPYPGLMFGASPGMIYADEDHLLLDNRELYDIKRKAVVWRYGLAGAGKFASRSPDGRLWYVCTTGFDGPAAIIAATLPEEEVVGYVKEVADGPNAVLKPGTKVAVDLEVTGTYADKAREPVLQAVKDQLRANGFEYDANAAMKLSLKISERKTGETIEFRKMFGGIRDSNPFARLSVAEIEILTSAELRSGGEVVWGAPNQKLRMGEFFGIIRLPDRDTNLTDYLYQQVWDKVPALAAGLGMPRFLAKTPAGMMALPGNTLLQAGGPTPTKPTVKR